MEAFTLVSGQTFLVCVERLQTSMIPVTLHLSTGRVGWGSMGQPCCFFDLTF